MSLKENLRFIWENQTPRLFFFLGFTLFLVTAFYNVGIIALDDYAFVVAQVIPAQNISSHSILENRGLWMPLHPWLLHGLSSFFYRLGVTDPYGQLQLVLVCVALVTFPLLSIVSVGFFESVKQKTIALFLVCFYFACPLFFTRPMIETICAPFLFLSCYFASRYWETGAVGKLVASIVALTVASVFRAQAGICVLALIFLVGARRSVRDLFVLLGTGTLCFVLSGLLDQALTGGFHLSLRGYLDYNLRFGLANHGHQPFYVFVSLFLALSIPPVFFARFPDFSWKETYARHLPLLSFFLVFLISHSMAPHKEERFMIPVLAVFLMLLVPLADALTQEGYSGWRVKVFLAVNFLVLPLACFNIPQKNILGLVRYLHKHDKIQKIAGVEETLVVYPKAFSDRVIPDEKIPRQSAAALTEVGCGTAVALREEYLKEVSPYLAGFVEKAQFSPAFLEHIFVVLNPKYNARRGTIRLFEKKGCDS